MKTIIGLSLLVFGVLALVFVYNKIIGHDSSPYYNAVISDKVIDLFSFR